jgi:hypothetical protein
VDIFDLHQRRFVVRVPTVIACCVAHRRFIP